MSTSFFSFYWVQMDNVTWRVLWNNPFWKEKLKYHFISFVHLRTYLAVQRCTLGSNLLALLGTYLDKQGQESNAWPSPRAMLKRPIWYPRIRNNWYLGNLNNGCKHALRICKTEKIENPFISSFASENVGKKVTWAIFAKVFCIRHWNALTHWKQIWSCIFQGQFIEREAEKLPWDNTICKWCIWTLNQNFIRRTKLCIPPSFQLVTESMKYK